MLRRSCTVIAFAACLFAASTTRAGAATITYDLAMTANTDNTNYTPAFGLPSEFGGPFLGTLVVTFQSLPWNGGTPQPHIDDFAVTIGNFTWDESDVVGFLIRADALGNITRLFIRADDAGGAFGKVFEASIYFVGNTPFWRAFDQHCLVYADHVTGPCIQGVGEDATLATPAAATTPVPEPATMSLLAAGLGTLLVRRRRTR